MFSHSCNGTNIFIRWKMKCTIQLGFASLNGTFHLSPHENICTIALINIHYLYTILFYSILFYSILFYSILFYSILFYSILFYSILFYSILFYTHTNKVHRWRQCWMTCGALTKQIRHWGTFNSAFAMTSQFSAPGYLRPC